MDCSLTVRSLEQVCTTVQVCMKVRVVCRMAVRRTVQVCRTVRVCCRMAVRRTVQVCRMAVRRTVGCRMEGRMRLREVHMREVCRNLYRLTLL